jgi:DNA-binding response OmpR family regulator
MAAINKILVVDDEISLVELCRIILQQAGYVVQGAFNGRQALKLVDESPPDLVLLDVMMPGMDGIEVCRQIRAQYAGPPPHIVMYTADDREETRSSSLAAGANDVLTKDIPVFDLPRRLDSYLAPTC